MSGQCGAHIVLNQRAFPATGFPTANLQRDRFHFLGLIDWVYERRILLSVRGQRGSEIFAFHRVRLSVGPADVRLLFDARLRGQCACDFQFTNLVTLI